MNMFKDDSVVCTKRRLFLLFMLNMSDWVCTLALLSTGMFEEANPIMKNIIQSPLLGFFVKVALPLLLILYAVSKLKFADSRQILVSNNIALFGVAVYLLINLYHLFCFSLVFILR